MNARKILFLLMFSFSFFSLPCQAQIVWGTPTTISTSGVNASDPHVVTDSNGNVTAIWLENGVVKASSIPQGGSWGTISSLSNAANTSSALHLRVDGSGNVTAVWLENGIVNTASLPFGGSWSAETALSNATGGASSPTAWVDSTGNKAVAWARGGFIESTQHPKSIGSWSTVVQVSTNGNDDNPNIFIGEGGTIVTVWHSIISGNDLVYSSTGTVNGLWGSPVSMIAVSPGAHHNYPKVVVDPHGNAQAIWYRYYLSGTNYYQNVVLGSTLSSTGTTWTAIPVQLSSLGMYNPAKLISHLAIDGNGDVIGLWSNSYDGMSFNVESGILPYTGTWQTVASLVIEDPYAYQFDVSAATLGPCTVNFMNFDGTNINIRSTETSINGIFQNNYSMPATISSGLSNTNPKISVAYQSSSNKIYGGTVWINYNGTHSVVQASVGQEAVLLPPTNFTGVQSSNNFGSFTEYFNTLSWTPSASPNITQTVLYRDGVAFASINASNTQFVDHNASQTSTTYGIAAVDTSFILSSIATVTVP